MTTFLRDALEIRLEGVAPPARPIGWTTAWTTSEGRDVRAGRAEVDGVDVDVTVALDPRGENSVVADVRVEAAADVTLRVELVLSLPSDDPWFMLPGAFYGENRPAQCTRVFPRFEVGASVPEQMVSDHWSFRADRCATPAAFVWGSTHGLALVVAETSAAGLTGVGFGHEDGVASVHARFPFREAPVTYYGSGTPRPASVAHHGLVAGVPLEVIAELYALPADRHAYAPVLRDVHARAVAQHPVEPWVDVDEAADLVADGLLTWHYDPEPGVLLETVGFDREIGVDDRPVDRQAMHVGWVSGVPWATALLAHGLRTGSEAHTEAGRRVIDHICSEMSPSGTFWGTWYREHGWRGSWTEIPHGLHARTLGEAALFLVRALRLERRAGRLPESWVAALRSNVAVLLARQRDDGNLGTVHDATTGEVRSWVGAAGLTWVSAFAELAESVEADAGLSVCLPDGVSTVRLREAACAAAAYYEGFVDREFLHGAPEDVDLAPTSEDGYAAVMAYTALHRVTGDMRWARTALRAAEWMLTFRYTYNVSFDEHTFLGRYGFATRGADQASTSNQHLHSYGLVCHAELAELSATLDDPHLAERAEETLAVFRQMIARQDGDINAYRGMVSERYYQTECFQPKGMLHTLSHAWCAGVLLLACEQQLGAFS